jgi:lipoate-protein ligase A
MEFLYLGHHRDDIYTLLAKEELMYQWVERTRIPLLVTAEVSRPAITIAEREDIHDIRFQECSRDGIDFTRRLGGGSVIWLDGGMLVYFVVIPVPPSSYTDFMKFQFHQALGRKIAIAIKELGAKSVYVGEKFSIALGKGPTHVVSGNTVILRKDYFSYRGVLVLNKLDVGSIKKYIVLRKNPEIDEEKILSTLPSISEVVGKDISPRAVAQLVMEALTDHRYRIATRREVRRINANVEPFRKKYRDYSWIFEPERITKRNAGFCLIAFSESWDEKNFYEVS